MYGNCLKRSPRERTRLTTAVPQLIVLWEIERRKYIKERKRRKVRELDCSSETTYSPNYMAKSTQKKKTHRKRKKSKRSRSKEKTKVKESAQLHQNRH